MDQKDPNTVSGLLKLHLRETGLLSQQSMDHLLPHVEARDPVGSSHPHTHTPSHPHTHTLGDGGGDSHRDASFRRAAASLGDRVAIGNHRHGSLGP